jgi:hypothetical protein
MGEAGQRAVLQRFNVQRMAEDVLNVYGEAARAGFPSSTSNSEKASYASS